MDSGYGLRHCAVMNESMDHAVIHGPSMPPPMGHYSQAVRVGNLLFVAGQPGIDLSNSSGPGYSPSSSRRVRGGVETGISES